MRRLLVRLLRDQRGYSLMELLVSISILGSVMASVSVLLVSATTSEVDMNRRFQAQTQARLGLDLMRREVHCAISVVTAAGPPARATLTLNTACPTAAAGAVVSWCTVQNGTGRYGLWRYVGAACTGTGVMVADYLSAGNVFTYYPQSTTSLAKLGVQFDVNLTPTKPERRFRLQDDLVLRNSTRA